MILEKFTEKYVEEARKLALDNYEEEREYVTALPQKVEIPDLTYFARNGLGVVAVEDGKLLGFWGTYEPWEGAFDTFDSLGTFCPLHAHGAVKENRARIYQDMFAFVAKTWAEKNILGFGIALYAHDKEALLGLFEYGFGMRCKDQIRTIDVIDETINKDLVFEELPLEQFKIIRPLRKELDDHLKQSPCFMQSTSEEFEQWVSGVEKGDRRTFVAKKNGNIVAYLDICDEGENFVGNCDKMKHIHGTYCVPEFRGQGIYHDLLHYVMSVLKEEGMEYLGVDHESYNPTANRFWPKHFTEYTNSVVRRIEQWSVGK